jgi:O-antigen biosynthesis protein WbqP
VRLGRVSVREGTVKRALDILLATIAGLLSAIPLAMIGILVKATSEGPVLYWSDRVGRHNRIFRMPKFRTMRIETPAVATDLLANPNSYLTSVGGFLRRTSLDELPQVWSILRGDMSFVGPRPALFNQDDLIALRTEAGVHELVPGLTGWAQINGRDDLAIPDKVRLDAEYLRLKSIWMDTKILCLTLLHAIKGEGVSH